MERELVFCSKALNPERPNVFVLGGAKPNDCLAIMKHMLEEKKLDNVLTSGTVGEIFLMANGHDLGGKKKFYEEKDLLKLIPEAEKLLKKYGKKIEMPVDVAIEEKGRTEIKIDDLPVEAASMDIGSKTVQKYAEMINKAKTIVMKGPAGMYEKEGFDTGTKKLLEAVTNSKGFKLVGGGDTLLSIENLGIDKNKFSYISLGGGALITYLSGKSMPGVEALKKVKSRS